MRNLLGIQKSLSLAKDNFSLNFEEIRHLLKGFLLGEGDRNSRKF